LNDAVPVVALFCKDYYATVLGSMHGVVMLILAYFCHLMLIIAAMDNKNNDQIKNC